MVSKHLYLAIRGEGTPVGHFQGHTLVVVEDRNSRHRTPPYNGCPTPPNWRGIISRTQYLGEGGDHVLGKQPHRFVSEFRCEATNPMAGAEDIVASALALLCELADHGVRATHNGQTVIDPEVIGFGAFLKHATEFLALRSTPLVRFEARRTEAEARLGDALATLDIAQH